MHTNPQKQFNNQGRAGKGSLGCPSSAFLIGGFTSAGLPPSPAPIIRRRQVMDSEEIYEALLGTQEQESAEVEAVHYYREV